MLNPEEIAREMRLKADELFDEFEEEYLKGKVDSVWFPFIKLGIIDLVEKDAVTMIRATMDTQIAAVVVPFIGKATAMIRSDLVNIARLALEPDGVEPDGVEVKRDLG